MAKKKYEAPKLDLKAEEPEVLSRDFNLFYNPQEEPLPAGLKDFANSLQNFSERGAVQASLLSETKLKKTESSKAVKDYNDLQLKFRDAVKDGKIDKNANPYYLQKYKKLTLNSFANEFSDRVLKRYNDLKVGENITEGAFEDFYKKELSKYIKEKKLGFFTPEELEESFFKETSEYRNQLEATHKQNLLENFNKSFDEKLKNRITGIITKFKNYDSGLLSADDSDTDKFDKIAEALQKEIGDLINTTGDGKETIDTIFDGIELYVETTDDYEFALELIQKLPKLLIGGTDSIENIGRIKNKTDELTLKLIEAQNEKLKNEADFENNKNTTEQIDTYNWLKQEQANNPEFNITKWKNEKERTLNEEIAADKLIRDNSYGGGQGNNPEIITQVQKLIKEEKYIEASDFISQALIDREITKETLRLYKETIIPNAMQLKGNVYFEHPYIKGQFDAWDGLIASGKLGGDESKAVLGTTYLKKHLLAWLKENENKSEYVNDKAKLQNDFMKQFDLHVSYLKRSGEFGMLFGKGLVLDTDSSALETLEKKITKQTKSYAQSKADFLTMSDDEFEEKHGETRKDFATKNGLTYEKK